MNEYAKLAQRHWTQTDPQRVAEIPAPEAFFAELGEQTAREIAELAASLEGPDVPGEGYEGKVGRLNMARLQAKEKILSELVWIGPPEDLEDEGDLPADDWASRSRWEAAEADRRENDPSF